MEVPRRRGNDAPPSWTAGGLVLASIVWPPTIPTEPLLRALDEAFEHRVVRTAMDAGPAKVRQRFTAGVRAFTIELSLTRTQVGLLDEFFHDTCLGGAEVFEWTHPRTGDTVDFRFLGPPRVTPRAPRQDGSERWLARFDLELIPTAVAGEPPDPPEPGLGGGPSTEQLLGLWTPEPDPEDLAAAEAGAPTIPPDIVQIILGANFDEIAYVPPIHVFPHDEAELWDPAPTQPEPSPAEDPEFVSLFVGPQIVVSPGPVSPGVE